MENYMDYNRGNMCNVCGMQGPQIPYYEYKPDMNCGYHMSGYYENTMPQMGGYYKSGYECNDINNMVKPMAINYTPLHKMVYEEVNIHIKKIMMSNMGTMPKSISVDMYKKELNEMTTSLMKKEKEIKRMMISREDTDENIESEDRLFCPYCQGFLGNMLGFVFLNSLINRGCINCY